MEARASSQFLVVCVQRGLFAVAKNFALNFFRIYELEKVLPNFFSKINLPRDILEECLKYLQLSFLINSKPLFGWRKK